MRTIRLAAIALSAIVTACSAQPTTGPSGSGPGQSVPGSTPGADVVLMNANVITMDDARPGAAAVAIRGGLIAAVGTNAEVAAFEGPATQVVDVGGRTIVPGFIDAHQHRIGDGPAALGLDSPKPIIDAAIEQGWTTINELYVDQARLNQLQDLDGTGVLRLRVNAYLPVQENSAEGRSLGTYFDAYQPGQVISPHVRVAGLKIFTDFDNAKILLWKQPALNAFVLEQAQKGWQLAVKTVSTRSLAMIINAFRSAETVDPTIASSRGLLEHMLFATSDQIGAIKDLGLVPVINLNNPGQLVGQPDVEQLVESEPGGSYAPWRRVFDAGLPAAGMSGFPSFHVDEPTGAPFGSPIHLIFQAVTRVGNLGQKPPPELLGQAISATEALRSLTINAARASFEEGSKGSISVGKLADLVLLSGDPLAVPSAKINEITVLMTMIGGKVESCEAGAEALCPVSGSRQTPAPSAAATAGPSNPPPGMTATASKSLPDSPPSAAIDGDDESIWNSGAAPPQWIQLDLGTAQNVGGVRLLVAQTPAGATTTQIWIGDSVAHLHLAHEFKATTQDGQELVWTPSSPLAAVRFIRILTTKSPSWVAWREIRISGG